MRLRSRWRSLAVSLLLCSLLVLAVADEDKEESCENTLLDEAFEDEQPLSLLQRRVTQIHAHRPSSATKLPIEDRALQPGIEQEAERGEPLSLLQRESTKVHAPSKGEPPAGMEDSEGESSADPASASPGVLKDLLDNGSLPEMDTKSHFYSFHRLAAILKERGQLTVLLVGIFILAALWAPSVFKFGKKENAVLQVQVRVDHFVMHSHSNTLTTKKEFPKTQNLAEAMNGISLPEEVLSSIELSKDSKAVGPWSSHPVAPGNVNCGPWPLCRPRAQVGLTPMDASFVLPLAETWYGVCVEPMAMCDGQFDILRIAGYPVLHGAVRHADGFRSLEITCSSLPAKQGVILARVAIDCPSDDVVPSSPRGTSRVLKVEGAGGKPYGYIKHDDSDGSYVLTCGQEDAIVLAPWGGEDGQQLVLRSAGAKKQLAQAAWFAQSDFFAGANHLAITINPNEDTILVLACTLALTILSGDKSLRRVARPADCGSG